MKEKGLLQAQIYSADETGIYLRAMPAHTLACLQETNALEYKVRKENYNSMLF
jgi:hypothetical protein